MLLSEMLIVKYLFVVYIYSLFKSIDFQGFNDGAVYICFFEPMREFVELK